MADERLTRIGAMLEELGARFDLVVEAVSGFGGRLDKLRDEVFGQFAEVGTQVRFLSDEIAENRSNLTVFRSDFGAEMVRLGETLGRTRVEFREQLVSVEASLRREVAAEAEETRSRIREAAAQAEGVAAKRADAATGGAEPESRRTSASSGETIDRGVARTIRELKREIATSAESVAKRLGAELKVTNRALAALDRKFERFDDRVTVQVRDQEQRLKKVEGRGRR